MSTPPPQDPTQFPQRRVRLPNPATKLGALFYSVVGSIIVWLLVEVLPSHLHIVITWH